MKPVCLFFFANDIEIVGQNLRKLAIESRAIELAMEGAAELCEFHIQKNTTADDIRRTLAKFRHRIALVHYAGHAESLQLMLETAEGGKEGLRSETLAEYLHNQNNIELVFLNGCSTGDQVEALLDAGIPYVISTNKAVDDQDATKLSTAFYEGLSTGSTIDEAWREAIAATRQQKLNEPDTTSTEADQQSRGATFTKKAESVSKASGFAWSIQSRPGIDSIPKWNLPEASNNPLLGLPPLGDELGFPEEPFQHLRRFTREEARVFFGRGKEILSLHNDITNKHSPPVTLYYGQSGVGKSSLLDAGLLPRLEHDYQVIYVRRSAEGITTDLLHAFGLTESPPNANSCDWLLQSWKAKEADGKPLILILDQLEEAWTHGTSKDGNDEIDKLAKWLAGAFRDRSNQPNGKAVLVFRKEWFPEIDSLLKAHKVARGGVFLKRLSEGSVTRAITLNKEARGYYNLIVDQSVAERITVELSADSDSPLAPTLQILLANMWKEAKKASRNQPEFSASLYQQLKDQGIQLSDFLDSQMSRVAESDPQADETGMLLSVLRFHCSELGTAAVRSKAAVGEHFGDNADKAAKIVGSCRQHFLIVDSPSDSQASDGVTRLAHDTLAPLLLKRFHESNRQAQQTNRILALRTQFNDEESSEPLTRRELKIVQKARPWMRRLSSSEESIVAKSQDGIKKANFKSWSLLAALAAVSLVAAWWVRTALNSAEVNRRIEFIKNADTPALVASIANLQQRASLSKRASQAIRAEASDGNESPDTRAAYQTKRNVAILDSLLGEPNVEEIVGQLEQANSEDILSFVAALRDVPDKDLGPLKALIASQVVNENVIPETDWTKTIQMRAKLTWLALLLGKSNFLEPEWFQPNAQAEPRTQLIEAIAEWFIDDDVYVRAIGETDNVHLHAALCQSVFFIPDSKLDEPLRQHLLEVLAVCYDHDRIAVRSSARAALTRLDLFAEVRNSSSKANGEDWFAIGIQTDAQLDFARVNLKDQRQVWLATTETAWLLMKDNLSQDRLLRREKKLKSINGVTLSNAKDAPARYIVWADALECCNYLTTRYLGNGTLTYSELQSDPDSFSQWSNTPGTGFRLPLASEWQVAAAAGSKDDYCFGNRFSHLQNYAWTIETADGNPHSVATLLPNALGFFDMHGNLQEWCWPAVPRAMQLSNGDSRLAGEVEMEKFVESQAVKTRDGYFKESRTESKLSHVGDNLRGTKFEGYIGFRLAISKRPDVINQHEGAKQ